MANVIKLKATSSPTFGIGIQNFTFDTNSISSPTTWVLPDNGSGYLKNDGSGGLVWDSSAFDSTTPYFIPSSETFTNNTNRQNLFYEPITVEGELVVNGELLDVSPLPQSFTSNPTPFYIPSGVSFTNYANSQVLFYEPITVEGELVVDGELLDVSPLPQSFTSNPTPFYIPSGVSFTNYANSQVLFAEEIAVDGELVIEGHMLDVTPPSPPLTNYWGNSSGSNFWASAPNTTSVSAIAGSTLSLAIGDNSHSYDNALAIGHSSSAGNYGTSLGIGASASYEFSNAIGSDSVTDTPGSTAIKSNGTFGSDLLCGYSIVQQRVATFDDTPMELMVGEDNVGTSTTQPSTGIVLRPFTTYVFETNIVATSVPGSPVSGDYYKGTTSTPERAAWNIKVVCGFDAVGSSFAFVGTPVITLLAKSTGASTWDAKVIADTVNGRPAFTVTGESGKTVLWNSTSHVTRIGYST